MAGGVAFCPRARRAQAVSSTLTALSGNCRPARNRCDSRTAAETPSSRMRTLWCFSSEAAMPRSMVMHWFSSGSSTFTTWKRRASAGSFSKYFLYSDHVVAAMVRSSPRASAGFNRLAASPWPACPPAPIMVWASSMNRMMGVGDDFTSSMSPFSRFSNSPLMPAPACNSARSRVRTVTFFRAGGTSPCAMRSAKPSTTAVFPTPASPVSMGLFWRRRIRMSITCRISVSRPSTGSSLPLLALAVRLTVNWSRFAVLPPAGRGAAPSPAASGASSVTSSSWEPCTSATKSFFSASGSIFCSSLLTSRTILASSSSETSASSVKPVRTCHAP